MENVQEQKIIHCLYCGNYTLMNLVGQHKEHWDEGDCYIGVENHKMYACPICKAITLLGQVWQEKDGNITENSFYEEIVYPMNTFHENGLPMNIKNAYESALKTRYVDSAICMIALRRTLEIICLEKDAQGRDLWHKIEDLSNRGILPKELKHASTITRTYGNMGAHDTEISISTLVLNQLIDFVRYILDYLYVLPVKLKVVQERLDNINQ